MLKRLKIWQKFTLITVAFSIPIVALSFFLMRETGKVVSFSAAEVDGTDYMRALRKLVLDVSAHRDLASAALAGDASYRAELDRKAVEIEADFKALEEVDARYAWQFGLTDELRQVRQAWQTLRGNFASFKLDQSFEEHTRYIRVLLRFSYRLGNASNLILDPDVDSYYLVDALIFKIPKVSEEISRARAIGSAYLASGGQGEENSLRRGELAGAVVRIEDALQQQADFIRFARNFNPQTDQALGAALDEHTKAVKAFTTLLAERLINASGEPMPLRDYFAAASVPLAEAAKLSDAASSELGRLLDVRVSTLNRSRWSAIGIVAGLLVISILLLFVTVRAITRPVAHLRDIADKISLGDMDAQIHIDSKDEIGELGDSFRRLQVSLKEAMDALERQQEASG